MNNNKILKMIGLSISATLIQVDSYAQYLVPVATDWQSVIGKVITCEQTDHYLYAEMELIHTESMPVPVSILIDFEQVTLTDVSTGKNYPILHDDQGHYLVGPLSGESSHQLKHTIKPGQKLILWAFFPPMPTPSSPVNITWPGVKPFQRVPIDIRKKVVPDANSSSDPDILLGGIHGHRLRKVAQLRVQVSLAENADLQDAWLYYRNFMLYDPQNQRIYSMMQDKSGALIAEPRSDERAGGRLSLTVLAERSRWLYLKFNPPPDWVEDVFFIAPFVRPTRMIHLSGKSLVREQSGSLIQNVPTVFSRAKEALRPVETHEMCSFVLSLDDVFAPQQFEIIPELPELQYLLALTRGMPVKKVVITVHQDNLGNPAFLLVLSNKQAESLGRWLTDMMEGACTVAWEGVGPQYPVASNETEEGRAKNRRIEIQLIK